jgi:hypothetical protein
MYIKKQNKFIEEIESIQSSIITFNLDESDAKFLLKSKRLTKLVKPVILNEDNKLIKTIPNVFFVLFMLMLALVFIKFIPGFVFKAQSLKLYKEKTKIKYFSEYFYEEPSIVKV